MKTKLGLCNEEWKESIWSYYKHYIFMFCTTYFFFHESHLLSLMLTHGNYIPMVALTKIRPKLVSHKIYCANYVSGTLLGTLNKTVNETKIHVFIEFKFSF